MDAAQSAGILDIDLRRDPVDFLCVPGHKGLYGPQGCGVMVVSGRFPTLKTLVEGGSGIHSMDPEMPSDLPERFEAGTLPTPAIAGLSEGINFVQKLNLVCHTMFLKIFLPEVMLPIFQQWDMIPKNSIRVVLRLKQLP